MAIYEITPNGLREIEKTTFSTAGVSERGDLQRLLRAQIEIISPDTLVIAEEFCEWEDSRRRIDLLGIDKEANLIVIELKRTEDGGHMELQAVRYAAMVSAMTFEKAVDVYAAYLARTGSKSNARTLILEFLEWEEPDEDHFAQDVRIVLVSADFSKELTTAVLWLNEQGLDIRCISMRPHPDNGRVLVEVQPRIPLPEAKEYQVKLADKAQKERLARKSGRDLSKYTITVNGKAETGLPKRLAAFRIVTALSQKGISPNDIGKELERVKKRSFIGVSGKLDSSRFLREATTQCSEAGRAFDPNRWFLGQSELIYFKGKTYAFSNQWGAGSLEAVLELLKKYPKTNIRCDKQPDGPE